jgi:hypothetical protein
VKFPLKALLLGLADTVGVALPVGTLIPKFFNHRLTSELRRAKDDYWLSRARLDASPCINMVGLEACLVAPLAIRVDHPSSVVIRESRSSYLSNQALGVLGSYTHGCVKASDLKVTTTLLEGS